jgi:sulfhydrogenase subunit gamma (sulfur reductase)
MTELNLQPKEEKLYLPFPVKVIEAINFTPKEKFLRLEIPGGKSLGNVPGQFVMVSILGIGEAPISISSEPRANNTFDLCFRAVGDVTNKMYELKVGDTLHVRGPFGNGYNEKIMPRLQGKELMFVAGGIGLAPLRSLINKTIAERKNYKKLYVLYGCKSPSERLYVEELAKIAKIGENVVLLETVDKGDETWKGNVGVITTLIPKVDCDPANTIVAVCGPPIMYKFVVKSVLDKKIPKENIYMSLERRMKCGVGKCGHCQMGGVYVCQEGSVFNYADVENNEEAL